MSKFQTREDSDEYQVKDGGAGIKEADSEHQPKKVGYAGAGPKKDKFYPKGGKGYPDQDYGKQRGFDDQYFEEGSDKSPQDKARFAAKPFYGKN